MREALVVGIDYYKYKDNLSGCVNDAIGIGEVLRTNFDGTPNFETKILTATNQRRQIKRRELKRAIIDFFSKENKISLFYFAGHGDIEFNGGYLIASDTEESDEGFPIRDLIDIATASPSQNKVIILDCCHSGMAGNIFGQGNLSILVENLTILAASKAEQLANEENGNGVFTNLLIDALKGNAANFFGDITLSSIYAHIDQSMSPLEQRPVFKANMTEYLSIRKATPQLDSEILASITELFKFQDSAFQLNPSFESTNQPDYTFQIIEPYANPENVRKFKRLQKLASIGLIAPLQESHMYFAALKSGKVVLTQLGRYYWGLIKKDT